MKSLKLLVLPLLLGTGLVTATTISANAKALTWHKGTPKVLRGTWYHNGANSDKAYITYSATKSTGNLVHQSDADTTYYKLPGYGLKKLKYQRLSKRVYQLSGIQYSPKGTTVQFDGQRLTYKVKVVSKHQLHFYKGYAKYTNRPAFKVVAHNHPLVATAQ